VPTKTERILSYLPETFRAGGAGSPLRTVVDAFGRELLTAENTLAALMRSHWVDHADRGAAEIDDLARMAALYGLAPRPDESVEEFREHLKRYVRTFLEGTVTVQGVLRVAAEGLGLTLADAPEELDSWWRRSARRPMDDPRPFVTRARVTGEAADRLLGFGAAVAHGRAATPAVVRGSRDLSRTADLRGGRRLRLVVDGGDPVEVDVAGPRPRATTLGEIVAAVEAALPGVARHDGRFLTLTSPTAGPASRIAFEIPQGEGDGDGDGEGEDDEAPGDARVTLFGEEVRGAFAVTGEPAAPAVLVGKRDLTRPADLSGRRRILLAVDGGEPRLLDAAGVAPSRTFGDEAVTALDAQVPGLASLDDQGRLVLTSPTAGKDSRLELTALRHLEVEEYPPSPAEKTATLRHGDVLTLDNTGAAAVPATVEVTAPHGAFGASLAPLPPDGTGRRRIAGVIEAGGSGRFDDPLPLPRGRSRWVYAEHIVSRFDEDVFDLARFAGEPCDEWAVFDLSTFAADPPPQPDGEPRARFAPSDPPPGPPVEARARWQARRPGAFVVHLPADLPPRWGGRFDEVRFAGDGPEVFADVVTEPAADPRHVTRLLADGDESFEPPVAPSSWVTARTVEFVPLGFAGVPMGFRKPRPLTLGTDAEPARLYLTEEGLDGVLEIAAREPGEWGNRITVAARRVGAARYEMSVDYRGGVFENARQAVRGAPLPAQAEQLLAPGPVGVLQAKAAGVYAEVRRERAELPPPDSDSRSSDA
jgi:hypothetical protein